MNDTNLSGLSLEWSKFLDLLQAKGIDFGINLAIALAIFYIGKFFVRLLVRATGKFMQKLRCRQDAGNLHLQSCSNLFDDRHHHRSRRYGATATGR